MATVVPPPSLQRTNSNGHFDIYVLIKNKVNDDLLIIHRDNLPPTLRVGKLVLNQKVTFRNEERQSIEGTIIYMNNDRENCVIAKNDLLQKRKQQKENSGNISLNLSNASDSQIVIGKASSKTTTKKCTQTQKKAKHNQSNKNSTMLSSTSLSNLGEDENTDGITHSSIEYSFSTIAPILNQQETTLPNANETSSTIVETTENEIYSEKINELSSKVSQLQKLIKIKDAEIKRLQSTTIVIPSDPAVQSFIVSFAEKVRENTTTFRYRGSLTNDAKDLGLSIHQLNEVLKSKTEITSVARDLFKIIIPEHRRQVDHWNQLPEDIIVKETVLINFLERYYGPLKVDKKKIHTSLVGCFRNERNTQKKQQEQSNTTMNQDKESSDIQNTDETNGAEELYGR